MMQIGIVRVRVPHRFVPMPMGMRLTHRPVMAMLVMFVVNMAVIVFYGFMCVLMIMTLGQMQPKA